MKKYLVAFFCVLTLSSFVFATAQIEGVRVTDQEAVLLFRYVAGAGVPLVEDTKNEILHAKVMMCSIYFNAGIGPKRVRCLLPHEQVRVENENAVEVTDILKAYNMPSDHKFGYETVQAGLDCTRDLSGSEYPICFLTPRILD